MSIPSVAHLDRGRRFAVLFSLLYRYYPRNTGDLIQDYSLFHILINIPLAVETEYLRQLCGEWLG